MGWDKAAGNRQDAPLCDGTRTAGSRKPASPSAVYPPWTNRHLSHGAGCGCCHLGPSVQVVSICPDRRAGQRSDAFISPNK